MECKKKIGKSKRFYVLRKKIIINNSKPIIHSIKSQIENLDYLNL